MKLGKNYVQFSKIMVVLILLSVTLLASAGVVGMMRAGEFSQYTSLFSHFTEFASVVFVSYSGNSVAEKWLNSNRAGNEANSESATG